MDSGTEPGSPSGTEPTTSERNATTELRKGDEVGRFMVLEEVGRGGMGVVVSAWDPELDRKVALKLLRPELTPTDGGTEARARLKREAQAMARLRHPNVVTVFEVGQWRGQLFIAMEHVPGGNLATWADARRDHEHGWREIVNAYAQAGAGLVAAHSRGLIHRDFKPANVLVDGDRFQVTDFGIASFGDDTELREATPASGNASELSLTRTGLLMGTAAYMAPERHRHEPADALTDQFAFCAALYESLYGQRAFGGKTSTAVAQAILEGKVEPPPPGTDVPEFVRKAVLRGLSRDPGDRWPSMADLLRILTAPDEADVGRRTRSFIGVILGTCFAVLPLLNAAYGIPFDTWTYRGAVSQSVALVLLFGAMSFWARESLRATPRNRQIFGVLMTVLALQIPLEVGHALLDIPVVDSHVMHLFFWGTVATVYAAVVDVRLLGLAAIYFVAFFIAVSSPSQVSWIAAAANACFVLNALALNRADRRRD